MFANYAEYEYYVTASLCILAMVGMGTTLSLSEFRGVARNPRAILLIVFVQIVVGPLLAIGLAKLFQVPPEVALGMLLVMALPGGLFSNVFAFLSRCDVALSVSATAICTLGSLVTTTLVLKVFAGNHLSESFRMPVERVLFEILFCLLLPLLIGMAIHRLSPGRSKPFGRVCMRAATALLVFVIVAALQSGRIDLSAYGWRIHAAIILLDVSQIGALMLLSWPFRVSSLDSFTGQIEVVVRNVHLGLLLKAALFPAVADAANGVGSGVIFVLLYYGEHHSSRA